MKEGKGMTEKWEQRISLGFLAISFLLFAVSVLCYAKESGKCMAVRMALDLVYHLLFMLLALSSPI